MPCVLQDNSEWIFGTYKLNVLTWLDLLLICIIFYLCLYWGGGGYLLEIKENLENSKKEENKAIEKSRNTRGLLINHKEIVGKKTKPMILYEIHDI